MKDNHLLRRVNVGGTPGERVPDADLPCVKCVEIGHASLCHAYRITTHSGVFLVYHCPYHQTEIGEMLTKL